MSVFTGHLHVEISIYISQNPSAIKRCKSSLQRSSCLPCEESDRDTKSPARSFSLRKVLTWFLSTFQHPLTNAGSKQSCFKISSSYSCRKAKPKMCAGYNMHSHTCKHTVKRLCFQTRRLLAFTTRTSQQGRVPQRKAPCE